VCSADAFTADAAFDVAPDWIALVDLDHVIRRVNKTMAAALGATPDELVGRKCHEIVHGSDEPAATCPHLLLLADSGEPRRDITEIPGRGVFEVLCAPLRDESGALAGTVHMMSDISRRVHVGVQAEEHAHYLQQLLDAVPTPIFHKDPQGRYVAVNTAFAEMAGLSRDDIIGKSAAHLFPEEVVAKIQQHDRRLLEEGGKRSGPEQGWYADRGVRSVELHRSVYADLAGRPAGIVGVEFDVTDAVETREALRSSEALLRGLFDAMPTGCVVYEARGEGRGAGDFVVKDINRTALAMDGLRRESVLGRRVDEVWPHMSEEASLQVLWRVWRTGDPETHATRSKARDGTERWHDDHLFRLPTGDVVELYSDVTAARRAQEALRSREAEMHAVFDLAGIPMIVMDTRGAFRRWNRAFAKALGYPPEDLRRMTVRDITVPEERADMLRRLAGAMDGEGTPYRLERRLITIDGRRPWFDVSVTPVLGEDDTVVALIAAGTDITESRRAKDALVASQTQLREALGETVASMGAIVAIRDPYTAGHERRVAELVVAIAHELGLPDETVAGLRHAASVHDVGKVAVPAEILTMPRRLSEWEYSLVQTHVEVGHEVLAGIAFEEPVAATVLQHHERLDGSGYPHGVRGDDIMLTARILAVADVVEAMASHRPYRPALGVGAAMDEIGWGSGRLYDESVVAACQRVVRRGLVDLTDTSV
jgi:PAS domain S-box-containing protein